MVGGNIAGLTRSMPTAIALETSKGAFTEGIALGIVLMVLAIGVNAVLSLVQRRGQGGWQVVPALNAILAGHDIEVRFGARTVLAACSLEIGAGAACVLTGDNGSGKTTLLRVLAGLYRADAGRIDFDGVPVVSRSRAWVLAPAWCCSTNRPPTSTDRLVFR